MAALWILVVVVVVGLAATLPAYAELLHRLELECPDEFERLGRPSLSNRSVAKSIALQRFLYFEARADSLPPSLWSLCRYLRVATALVVATVAAAVLELLRAGLDAL